MDGGGPDAPPTARWLALAAFCLFIAALVSAGVVGFGDGSPDGAVVSAAGTGSTTGVPSTVTVPPPPPSTVPPAPTSTVRTTTTLPRAASEVLRAIGTTAPPTTRPPAPATTQPPVTATTPTTARPPTTTTSSTVPRQATVTVVNRHGSPFVVTVNGRVFDVDPEESEGPVAVTLPATGDDVIQVRARGDASCLSEGKADYFQPDRTYTVTVSSSTGQPCQDHPAAVFKVEP